MFPSPPPPLTQQLPPLKTHAVTKTPEDHLQHYVVNSSNPPSASAAPASGDGMSPRLLLVAAIVFFVFVASAFIHLLLRLLSRLSSSTSSTPSSSSSISGPLVLLRRLSSSSSSAAGAAATPPAPSSPSDDHRRPSCEADDSAVIDSLPLFTLSSPAVLQRSSPDCAVCLSRFHPDDQLRLLPSCRHAFHSTCIDPWLRFSLFCPICRSPVPREPRAPPQARPLPPEPQAAPPALAAATVIPPSVSDRSGSYRVEIGSVSRRRTPISDEPAPPPPRARSYSLGSSFEYVVDEEVEAVVSAIAAQVRQQRQREPKEDSSVAAPSPTPPGEEVAEAAGGEGSRTSWLRDYVDRLASSASSSFSSIGFSRRGSRHSDGGVADVGGSWDVEWNIGWPWPGEDEEGAVANYYASFSRWLTGE